MWHPVNSEAAKAASKAHTNEEFLAVMESFGITATEMIIFYRKMYYRPNK